MCGMRDLKGFYEVLLAQPYFILNHYSFILKTYAQIYKEMIGMDKEGGDR